MTRWLLSASLLFACTKARTDNAATSSSPPPSGAASAPSDATLSAPLAGGSAAPLDASAHAAAGTVEHADRGLPVKKVGSGDSAGAVEMYEDPTPVTTNRSPGDDLDKQLGGARSPAKGGRSLVVVKRAAALDPSSSLDAAAMEYEYVARGRADVKRCFEALRAKEPAAKGEITLRFTVDTAGAVLGPEVTGFNADVSKCVQTSMPGWKFTAPNKPTRFELVLDLVIG